MNNKNFEIYLDFGSAKIRGAAFNKKNNDERFLVEKNCASNFKLNFKLFPFYK